MKTKTKEPAVIAGFRAVESAHRWKTEVARDTEGLSAKQTLEYFRSHARRLSAPAREPSLAKVKTAAKP